MVELRFKEFPTHVAYTSNKVKEDKYAKINNQSIYNGKLSRFSRNTAVRNLRDWIWDQIPKNFRITDYPVYIQFTFKTVKNHGSIQRRKGQTIWKPHHKSYKANWDIENFASLWIKVINDTLTKKKCIIDDSVVFIRGIYYKVEFVDTLEEREIIVNFIK